MVAFHFQFANQAGWKCDICRNSGLERQRRCGWLGLVEDVGGPPVWARREIALWTCPKAYITAESAALIEEFAVRRRLGGMHIAELPARHVEAFAILEKALAEEGKHGRQNTRSIDS